MSDDGLDPDPITPQTSADYIADMMVGLRKIALAGGHRRLTHFIDMAHREASILRSTPRRSAHPPKVTTPDRPTRA